jgi:hypothetical protein
MSSEISIEAGSLKTGKGRSQKPIVAQALDGQAPPEEGFRPWHFFLLASILLATVAVMLARQSSPENLILISLTVASAGAAAAAFYRMLAPLTQDVVLRIGEPVSERTRTALEREKMLVLRSIKELEFDHAMGKLSQKDFEEMSGRLRTRALTLMRQLELDPDGYKSTIERELEARLKSAKISPAAPPAAVKTNACAACHASNDADAVFCKKCGARIAA